MYALAAVASEGYYQLDEHFQVLEFADYKLGVAPAADLPWEFHEQIRPALLPALAVAVIKGLHALGAFDPFAAALVLRLISGCIAVLVYWRISRRFASDFAAESTGKVFLLATVLLWFVPYLSVRFSAENWSAMALLVGVSLLLPRSETGAATSHRHLVAAGLLLGLAFVLRPQLGFALVGIAGWLAAQRRMRSSDVVPLVAGGVGGLMIGVAVDSWFYGSLVFTPWAYFAANILEGKAAEFGVSSWWYYLPAFVVAALPPISLVLLVLVGAGIWRKPGHIFTWILVPFVLGHMLVGHKELRFLFPVLIPFLWLAVAGLEAMRERFGRSRVTTFGWWSCVGVNALALAYVCTRPAQQFMPCWHFLYDYSLDRHVTLYAEERDPYDMARLKPHFYAARNLTVRVVPALKQLNATDRPQLQVGDLLLQRHLATAPVVRGYQVERVFHGFPDWMLRFNVGGWEGRTEIWTVYRIAGQRPDSLQ